MKHYPTITNRMIQAHSFTTENLYKINTKPLYLS
jgi:hypothetical protein